MAYEFQPYPSWRYHRDGRALIVDGPDADARLTEGDEANWSNTPATFAEPAPAPAAAPAPAEAPEASDPGPETEDAPAPPPAKKSRK